MSESKGGTDDTLPATVASGIAESDTARAEIAGADVQLPNVEESSYELREQLGAGGMGKVVVARDRRLGRLLAIKVAQTSDRSMRLRFTREAVLTARLQHPSIIPVHEAGVWSEADEPFYAMKLVAGASLARLIAKTQTLDERLALIPNVIAVVDALAYAHSQRVIHRDLKPDNVIVGEYGETIVIDWGLAKELDVDDDPDEQPSSTPYRAFDAGQTVEGAAMGTPPYMPPEQAAGERVDERADVYGLGAMLYHVLSGVAPYKGKNADEVMEQVLKGPPIPLAERQEGIPKDLLAIVDKAMAREPADRYANAKFLAEDLKRFERGQLVAAHAYSKRELLRRWLVKHRTTVGAAIIAVLAIGVAVGLWVRAELRDRAARERRVAEIVRADDTDHGTAVAQLHADDFSGAVSTIERQIERLKGQGMSEIEHRREGELARAKTLESFRKHAKAAAFLVGDEDKTEDGIHEMTEALRDIGAIDADGHAVTEPWWDHLFVEELTPEQRADMQAEAYRLVLELAGMRFKAGALLVKMKLVFIEKSPQSAAHFRSGLDMLSLATPLERVLGIKPARVTRIWQTMTLYFLRGVGTEEDVAAIGAGPLVDPPVDEPSAKENATDYWFLGVGQYLVSQTLNTTLGQAMKFAFPTLFDYEHPLDTADQQLRAAIRFDPHLYWPHFMLGMALRDRGDYGGAELAFDACVMVEPTYLLGFGARSLVLAKRAEQQPAGPLRDETLQRAMADSEETLAKAKDHPATHWARGDFLRALGKRGDAIEAYTHALELEDNVLAKFAGQVVMREITEWLKADLPADDVAARDLLAFIALASKDYDGAIRTATDAIALRADDARAHAVLGTALLATDKPKEARVELAAALRTSPANALAALGLARADEATGASEDALAEYAALAKIAVVREHTFQAQLGIYRVATKLGRTAEAAAAKAAAHGINEARSIP